MMRHAIIFISSLAFASAAFGQQPQQPPQRKEEINFPLNVTDQYKLIHALCEAATNPLLTSAQQFIAICAISESKLGDAVRAIMEADAKAKEAMAKVKQPPLSTPSVPPTLTPTEPKAE